MNTIHMLSLVIPVYNEEENLPILHGEITKALENIGIPYEVLFIDDGSTDTSLAVMKDLAKADSRVKYLAFAQNRGQSAGFTAGFREVTGDFVVTMDADLQNDPRDIPKLVHLIQEGFDMAIGWRAKRKDTWFKRVASKFANWVRNQISRETVKDTGCSLKIMRTEMARRIPMFKGMHRFLPTLMKLEGATVAEIQVNHRPRQLGVSKYGIWDRAFSAAYDLLAVQWMQKRYITYQIKERN